MGKKRLIWTLASLLFALGIVGFVAAQQVFPTQQTQPVQVQPPGNPNTLQTAWCSTSTGGAQANTITEAAVVGKTHYATGFEITGLGATSQTSVTVTLASGGTTIGNWTVNVPAGATTSITPLVVEFELPIAGLSPGTSMVLTVPTFGSGNTAASATFHGFDQ